MADTGRVIGGHYLDSMVSTARGSELVVRSGFKGRKLNEEQVTAWQEILSAPRSSRISTVGQAVTGAVLPRFLGKAASAAVGATIDSAMRPPRVVRIDWADGKRSLIKLPRKLFTHLELMLQSRQVPPVELPSDAIEANGTTEVAPTLAEQALTQLSGLLRDKLPTPVPREPKPLESAQTPQPDLEEHLTKLAALRDAGILTEDEFVAKKTELLSRL